MNNHSDGWPPIDRMIMEMDGGITVKRQELRDEFAMRAISGMMANDDLIKRHLQKAVENSIDPDVLIATSAYAIADAMMKERAK